RISVLEFVDEDASEARLERLAHRAMLDEQVSRTKQQVDEIQSPRALLELLVGVHDLLELVSQTCGKVGIRRLLESIQLVPKLVVTGPDLLAWRLFGEHPVAPLARAAEG